MIAFGCSIINPGVYEQRARVGIERAAEPDSQIFAHAASGSIARSYNLLLDTAAVHEDLEAVVLVHEDAEILDPDLCAKLRAAFADPAVAVAGPVGAVGVRDIAWWDGTVTWNSAALHYGESGGGELTFGADGRLGAQQPGEVDSLYGVLLAFSPWAARNLRCDESIGILHGYDFDICRQARGLGRKVVAADLRVAHHHALDLVGDIEIWVAAHMRACEQWDRGEELADDEWRPRARRAEASAGAARLLAASKLLQADAVSRQNEAELDLIRNSRSWRMTEPLRRGNALLRAARSRLTRS